MLWDRAGRKVLCCCCECQLRHFLFITMIDTESDDGEMSDSDVIDSPGVDDVRRELLAAQDLT